MATAAPRQDWPRTVPEFEAWHARQPERWEFIAGQPRLMAPASMAHTIIKTNLGTALGNALADRGCTTLVDGAQILTEELSAIPDVVVTCTTVDLTTPVIAEPAIIVEMLSPASEGDDTLRKWFGYRRIPSLQHDLVISQDRRRAQIHSRAGDLWRERFAKARSI
jgi:Uma2 family endonuclease